MNVLMKIIAVHPSEHSVEVRYYTDIVTEDILAIQRDEDGNILRCKADLNVTLPVPTPQGEELETYLSAHAPRAWLELQESLRNPEVDTSLSALQALVGVEKPVSTPTPPELAMTMVFELPPEEA